MKTQGEIEASICEGMARFEQEYMGRGPKDIHAYLIADLLVVRLQGVLTAAEQQLVKTLPSEKGRDLLKQVRTQLMETARPVMEAMVQEVTGSKGVECAPRYQHRDRRRSRPFHPGRAASFPRDKEKIGPSESGQPELSPTPLGARQTWARPHGREKGLPYRT
jgi:uncharacterized protein YbcI